MFHSATTRSRGISVLEILIALGLLVVIISFASPSLSSVTAKAELHAAVKNTEFSIRAARQTARILETDVIMQLHTDPKLKRHYISYSLPKQARQQKAGNVIQDFQYPAGIRLVSEQDFIQFDSRGVLEQPVKLKLVSVVDDDISERLLIE